MSNRETFCHRCLRVVKTTVAGACVACGVVVAAPTVGVGQVGGHVPFGPAVTAAPFAAADGPHVPESPFTVHVPGAESGGTATTTFTGSVSLPRMSAGGAARTT